MPEPALPRFRYPDAVELDNHGDVVHAIWYDPDGPLGDHATEVILCHDSWTVNGYVNGTGLLDDLDPDLPFIRSSITVTFDDVDSNDPCRAAQVGTDLLAEGPDGTDDCVASLPLVPEWDDAE
uniref:Uncharacterized protein n=1 Tax=viral metagenome TaxID=1070528 RepID=A0A6M3L6X4_9ZZZZ